MAKKNRNTSNVGLNSENEIKCLAYELCITEDEMLKKARRQLLLVKKKYFLEDTKKATVDQRKTALFTGSEYQDLITLLEAAEENQEIKDGVVTSLVLSYVAAYGKLKNFRIKNGEYTNFTDIDPNQTFRLSWTLVSEYLMNRYEYEDLIACVMIENHRELIEDALSYMYKVPNGWIKTIKNMKDDNEYLSEYKNDSSFYKDQSKVIASTIKNLKHTSAPTNSSACMVLNSRKYACIENMLTAIRDYEEQLKEREKKSNPLLKECDPDAIPPTYKEIIWQYVANAASKVAAEYALSGLNIVTIISKAEFSNKDCRESVKAGFIEYELENGKCSYNSRTDQRKVIEKIVRIHVAKAMSRQTEKLYAIYDSSKQDNEELGNARKQIKELREENDSLNSRLNKKKEPQRKSDRHSQESKELRSEIAALRKQLKEKNQEIEDLNNEIEEIKYLIEDVEEIEYANSENEKEIITEAFRDFLKENRVLAWGLRDDLVQRYQECYPELRIMSSDDRMSRKQLEGYDAILINTGYTNHGSFWRIRDMVKNSRIKYAYIPKYSHDPYSLAEAWNNNIRNKEEK